MIGIHITFMLGHNATDFLIVVYFLHLSWNKPSTNLCFQYISTYLPCTDFTTTAKLSNNKLYFLTQFFLTALAFFGHPGDYAVAEQLLIFHEKKTALWTITRLLFEKLSSSRLKTQYSPPAFKCVCRLLLALTRCPLFKNLWLAFHEN